MTYTSALDVAALTAIDTHVHVEKDTHGHLSLPGEVLDAAAKYFKAPTDRLTIDETADYYRERSMAAVVFTVDATTKLGHAPNSTEEIVAGAARNNDVLIPFGSVDPHAEDAVDRARGQIEDLGVRGFKFHPTLQDFDPSDERYFPLYEVIAAAGLPAIFHTGQTGIGARLPGGFGLRLGLSNPMLLDVVAATFPGLTIIMAHPSVPWQDEAISVATHKGNVYIDLSGWSPKYFPPALVKQANSVLQDKVLFGSDFPLLTPERWLRDFAALELKDEVRPKILKDNAVRVLGLGGPAGAPASAGTQAAPNAAAQAAPSSPGGAARA
ncbi:amidohydrolase family protein [Georgenia yuyongxinii]|uniref:Amidohydrolase n=1 Tax=Georgenia yuyongxinii TaxID=2589797 RepID=A0A552WQA4_9MICO|nr:amidohydrolase family protein [Georgenia yuyongxinii]TRW44683.1 amidohydrolase [Georgenia yuyongxinii]